jgi:hypothetical protein
LKAACPDRSIEDLNTETIGRRDQLLLALRKQIFGPRLDCTTDCPRCHQVLEFALHVDDLESDAWRPGLQTMSLTTEHHVVAFRLPDSGDLLAIERSCASPQEAATALLDRCVLQASEEGRSIPSEQLPPEVAEAIDAAMRDADPQASVEVSLSCPECAWEWMEVFDIGGYLWEELDAWAHRVARDVHVLASAYSWSEDDILGMTAERRGTYLDLIRG